MKARQLHTLEDVADIENKGHRLDLVEMGEENAYFDQVDRNCNTVARVFLKVADLMPYPGRVTYWFRGRMIHIEPEGFGLLVTWEDPKTGERHKGGSLISTKQAITRAAKAAGESAPKNKARASLLPPWWSVKQLEGLNVDTLAKLARMEAGELPGWLEQHPDTLDAIREAVKARADGRQGMTPDEVAALSFVLGLA